MSSLLYVIRPTRIRAIGLGASTLLLIAVAVVSNLQTRGYEDPDLTAILNASPSTESFVLTTVIIASVLSWLLADRAVEPGWRSALATILIFDFVAVLVGSFLVSAILGVGIGGGPLVFVGGTFSVAIIGLVFLGIPMLVLGFLAVAIWIGLVRLGSHIVGLREDIEPGGMGGPGSSLRWEQASCGSCCSAAA